MPRSVYLLARHLLRVDGVVVRLRDTRVWARFQCPYLLREHSVREATFEDLANVRTAPIPHRFAPRHAGIPLLQRPCRAPFVQRSRYCRPMAASAASQPRLTEVSLLCQTLVQQRGLPCDAASYTKPDTLAHLIPIVSSVTERLFLAPGPPPSVAVG